MVCMITWLWVGTIKFLWYINSIFVGGPKVYCLFFIIKSTRALQNFPYLKKINVITHPEFLMSSNSFCLHINSKKNIFETLIGNWLRQNNNNFFVNWIHKFCFITWVYHSEFVFSSTTSSKITNSAYDMSLYSEFIHSCTSYKI